MIDPPKATKGRRMSKKTRKTPPKTSSGKAVRARSITSAKTPPSKSRRATPSTSGKKAKKNPGEATPRVSHKAGPRSLKSSNLGRSGNPPVKKALGRKAAALVTGKSALAEGAEAPAFRLPRDGGGAVSLSDYTGRKLVLFFYPRADTPGCTKEAIDFTRLAGAFAESQTAVLGISADPLKVQEAFRDKHELSVPLASDEEHEMLDAYGAWGEKSMYGRTFQGILRTTVLIDPGGRIVRIWRNVRVDGHADEVLAAARTL
jgi:peroxiredoxin Q/BCP